MYLTIYTVVNASGEYSPGILPPRPISRCPPVASRKSLRRLASMAQLPSNNDQDSTMSDSTWQNDMPDSGRARSRSVSEVVTDVQEYDEQGRLRRRSITRQSSGSSIGTSTSASVRAKPGILKRLSLNVENSTNTSAPRQVEQSLANSFISRSFKIESAERSSQIDGPGLKIRYLDNLSIGHHDKVEGDILTFPVRLAFQDGRDIVERISRRLCKCAFEFAARKRMPLFHQDGEEMIRRPEDRNWVQWVHLLREVILDRRTTICCEPHRAEFLTTLHRSNLLEPEIEYREIETGDDMKALQLISAGLQVAKIFEDASAMEEFDQLYNTTVTVVANQSLQRNEPKTMTGKKSRPWSTQKFWLGSRRSKDPAG